MRVKNLTGVEVRSPKGFQVPASGWISPPKDWPLSDLLFLWRHQMVQMEPEGRQECEWDESVYWMSPLTIGDGYGTAAENLLLALDATGMRVYAQDCWFVDKNGLRRRTLELLQQKPQKPVGVGLCMATPADFHRLPTYFRIGLTMYEADEPLKRVPEWKHYCESADMLVVPSAYCKRIFEPFYRKRIEICPLPISPMYQSPVLRKPKDTFTFITYGTLSGRKSPIETADCFKAAFPADKYPDVRLILKTRGSVLGFEGYAHRPMEDDRITVVNETWMPEQVLSALYEADCGLFLTRGEGYGMPPREMMATGLPVIFAANTGLEELANKRYNWPISTKREEQSPLGGNWRIPDWDEATHAMKQVYEHREAAYAKAFSGAEWLIKELGQQAIGQRLKKIILDLPRRRPRRSFASVEKPTSDNISKHQRFYDLITSAVPPRGTIVDVGVGSGLAYEALTRRGYHVIGLVLPSMKEEVQRSLSSRRLPVTLYTMDLAKGRLPSAIAEMLRAGAIQGAVCQGVLQEYPPSLAKEVAKRVLSLAPGRAFVSVPSAFYPSPIGEGATMQRMEYWDDTLSAIEMEMGYYAEHEHLYMRLLRDVPPENKARRHGYVHNGHWVPGNQMLRQLTNE